jgi:hypothetical protein
MESTITLRGARLGDAQELFLYFSGITCAGLEVSDDNSIVARLKIAPDCRLGEHALRVRTSTGISELRTFYVGSLNPVDEIEPNSDFSSPQEIPFNVTVNGIVTNEDVDYFQVSAAKGQRISAEIEGIRLGETTFDPYVAILSADRFELAACDDSALTRQDSAVSITAPTDGVYIIEARECSYGGSAKARYRLHVGGFPRPMAVYPGGGRPGDVIEVTLIGDASGPIRRSVKVPAAEIDRFSLFADDEGGVSPSGVPFRISDLENVLEVEPNGERQSATSGPGIAAYNGVIQGADDVDWFQFKLAKGQSINAELYARRIGSVLDAVVAVFGTDGGRLAGGDDERGLDSAFQFIAPKDGEYFASVADHLAKGGPAFVYRLELTNAKPSLSVSIPPVEQFSQERQALSIPRGNRFATLMAVSRAGFSGVVALSAEDLPAGVEMIRDPYPADRNVQAIVFEASDDAPLGGTLCRLIGRHGESVKGAFRQRVPLVTERQSVYWSCSVDRLAAAVTEQAPFSLTIVEPRALLVQGGTLKLNVIAERHDGFTSPIAVKLLQDPPGVSSSGGISIPEGASGATISLTANGSAQVRDWKIVAVGSADSNGKIWVASPFAKISVAERFFTIALQKSAVEQGKKVTVHGHVNVKTPFEGEATVSLVNLPAHTKAAPIKLSKDASECDFEVEVGPSSPAGRHQSLQCQVDLIQHDEPITFSTAPNTELRIDSPLPERPHTNNETTPPPPPPHEKKLTRLQQLRLEFKRHQASRGRL